MPCKKVWIINQVFYNTKLKIWSDTEKFGIFSSPLKFHPSGFQSEIELDNKHSHIIWFAQSECLDRKSVGEHETLIKIGDYTSKWVPEIDVKTKLLKLGIDKYEKIGSVDFLIKTTHYIKK